MTEVSVKVSQEFEEMRSRINKLESLISMNNSIFGWINEAASGKNPSDFGLSFPIVREVWEMRNQIHWLEAAKTSEIISDAQKLCKEYVENVDGRTNPILYRDVIEKFCSECKTLLEKIDASFS